MLNNLNKKLKKIVKLPQNLLTISTKLIIYIGLVVYWGVILLGTFIQIY